MKTVAEVADGTILVQMSQEEYERAQRMTQISAKLVTIEREMTKIVSMLLNGSDEDPPAEKPKKRVKVKPGAKRKPGAKTADGTPPDKPKTKIQQIRDILAEENREMSVDEVFQICVKRGVKTDRINVGVLLAGDKSGSFERVGMGVYKTKK